MNRPLLSDSENSPRHVESRSIALSNLLFPLSLLQRYPQMKGDAERSLQSMRVDTGGTLSPLNSLPSPVHSYFPTLVLLPVLGSRQVESSVLFLEVEFQSTRVDKWATPCPIAGKSADYPIATHRSLFRFFQNNGGMEILIRQSLKNDTCNWTHRYHPTIAVQRLSFPIS
jgi:hypothetical protein